MDIDHVLAAAGAALNEQRLEHYDAERVQALVRDACGESELTLDPGGGLHDQSGARIGAIRRDPGGEWIVERQNPKALNANAPIPSAL